MPEEKLVFADAEASFEEADFVVFGAPFEGTVSHRTGTSRAPSAIRKESYNFETYLYEYDIDLTDIAVQDAGDLSIKSDVNNTLDLVYNFAKFLASKGKFPIMLGGEHSMTVGVVRALWKHAFSAGQDQLFGVIVLDAHLDFRDNYEGERFSHACVTRRLLEFMDAESVIPIGIRSMSRDERTEAAQAGLKYYDMNTLKERDIQLILEDARDLLPYKKVYLSVDMDVLDPAYAPGVGNPEPFGLRPDQVKACIESLADDLVGFDIMEVCPPMDNGNTASLAARLIRNVIGLKGTKRD